MKLIFSEFQGTDYAKSPILNIKMRIDEVWTYRHFEVPEYAAYNEKQKYFLYGDDKEAFMSHIITKEMDFHQVSFEGVNRLKKSQ